MVWVLLFVLLLKRDVFIDTLDVRQTQALEMDAKEEYQGVFFKTDRIGFVKNSYQALENNDLLVEQEAVMHINVLETTHPIFLSLTATLSPENRLKNFSLSFKSPFYTMSATGKAVGSRVEFTLNTGNNTISDHIQMADIPMLSTSRRGYLLQQGIEPGTKIKVPWFDPLTLTAKNSIVEYKGKEKILIHGRIHSLHHFTELSSGTRINSWLNDNGDVIKEESPAGFVFLKEPEFKARNIASSSTELLSAVSVKVKGKMPSLKDLNTISYRLSFPQESEFVLNSGRQTFSNNVLTISKEDLSLIKTSSAPACKDDSNSLSHSAYIQSNHPDIISLSNQLIGQESDPLKQTRILTDWVFKTLKKRPVLGIPDALTTLKNKIGDCNEHAVLFAALARAADIPTRIAAGVVYHKNGFYYHAWNEVCIGNQWISLDATTNQLPADLSHIKFIQGELQEQVKIGSLIGKLTIEPILQTNFIPNPSNPNGAK